MAKRIVIVLLILVSILNFSCKKKDCLKSAGDRSSESRNLGTFRKIEIYNYFNVYLKQDTVNKIEIEAGENQVPNIETSVIDSVLIISDLNACGFIKGYADKNLYISVDTLNEVEVFDGVNLYSVDTLKFSSLKVKFVSDIGHCDLTVDCNRLTFQVWYGTGDYFLKGKTNYLYFDIEYLAFGYANELEAQSAYVYQNSMGNSYVNVAGQLRALIVDEGNIFYKGNPAEIIIEEHSGSGKLIKND
jgi:hypothetical protein